ncbi:unnamed protein product [Lampetra planeri]
MKPACVRFSGANDVPLEVAERRVCLPPRCAAFVLRGERGQPPRSMPRVCRSNRVRAVRFESWTSKITRHCPKERRAPRAGVKSFASKSRAGHGERGKTERPSAIVPPRLQASPEELRAEF